MEIILGFTIGAILAAVISFFIFKSLTRQQEDRFTVIAKQVLDQNSNYLKEKAQSDLEKVIGPLNERVGDYKNYLDKLHKYDLQDRENLRERLTQMIESANKIGVEASSLTQALSSDVKFQGAWGELTLERILELAGLEKGVEYYTQEAMTTNAGKSVRPDVVIKLPNEAHIIIDSKVSLKAYFDYVNSNEKQAAVKALKTSIQTHIDSLSKKNYQNVSGANSPDFVYLFIPVEGVYSLVLGNFPELIDESIKKNIVLVSPVNIMSNLKTVASLWRLEKQSKNAEELARKAGLLYDKFVSMIDDVQKLGTHMKRAQDSHADILKKLSEGRGNLVGSAEELKSLGAKTSKSVDNQLLS